MRNVSQRKSVSIRVHPRCARNHYSDSFSQPRHASPQSRSSFLLVCCAFATILTITSPFAHARLEVVPEQLPHAVFAGNAREIRVVFRNPDDREIAIELRTRLFQASSATAMPVSEQFWKTLRMLPHQTVIESAFLDFPAVNAATRFLVQWADEREVYGTTEVLVYPLGGPGFLKPAFSGRRLGVFDPRNELKPHLKNEDIEFDDLAGTRLGKFHGEIVLLGPFATKEQTPAHLTDEIATLAQRNVAVLLFAPVMADQPGLEKLVVALPAGEGLILIAPATEIANLDTDPLAQARLLSFVELAVKPNRIPFANLTR